MGFLTPASIAYHEVWSEATRALLASRFDFTSLYLRSRADRIAIHRSAHLTFEWECKCMPNTSERRNLAVEALPLITHFLLNTHFGVNCLYVCKDSAGVYGERGFWTEVGYLPKIEVIHIPRRWKLNRRNGFRAIFKEELPGISVRDVDHRSGSGDPYALISEATFASLLDWRDLVKDYLNEVQSYGALE